MLIAMVRRIQASLEARRNPAQAVPMAQYMRNKFAFLGLKRPEFQAALAHLERPNTEAALLRLATQLWRLPEREYQHVAIDWLDPRHLTPAALPALRALLEDKSWWDSVDGLTCYVIGPLIQRERALQKEMDGWSRDANFWLRRAAIIHQLGFKRQTDTRRLFAYCTRNARDQEFFIRKAIGWALRVHARVDADAVREYVEAHPELSALSRREALKRI